MNLNGLYRFNPPALALAVPVGNPTSVGQELTFLEGRFVRSQGNGWVFRGRPIRGNQEEYFFYVESSPDKVAAISPVPPDPESR
jgi:hypothetical protein